MSEASLLDYFGNGERLGTTIDPPPIVCLVPMSSTGWWLPAASSYHKGTSDRKMVYTGHVGGPPQARTVVTPEPLPA